MIAVTGEGPQVIVLGLAQSQRAGERIDGGEGRVDAAALFQPDVPVDADTRELGHFLAPQARRAATAGGRKADRFGPQPLPS